MASSLYEPLLRVNHFAALAKDKLYVWGGITEDFAKKRAELKSRVEIFDISLESWDKIAAKGSPPPGLCEGACASSGQYIYTYGGGYDGESLQGTLNHLDTKTYTWKQLSPHTNGGPMKKSRCGMVFYQNKLVLFGGYIGVPPTGHTQPGASYKDGRTNELHVFDMEEGTWSSPKVSGTRPPPCSAFSFTMIDDHHAVLFGGVQFDGGKKWTNDTYILDLKIMNWSKLTNHDGAPSPVGRSSHVAVCLNYGRDNPQLLVTGGWDKERVLSDAWILDLESERWRKILLQEDQKKLLKRCDHTAVSFSYNPGLTEVVIFGGDNSDDINGFNYMAHTTLLRFEYKTATKQWVLKDITDNCQRGTEERIRQKRDINLSLAVTPQQPYERERTLMREMKEKVRDLEKRAEESYKRAQLAERRLAGSEQREREADKRASLAEERAVKAERRAVLAEERLKEAERREHALELEKKREEERRRWQSEGQLHSETQWVVGRGEINLTGPELGRGGWATVSIAMFRGVCVAAKSIQQQIISPHNIQMFRREMNMAARIRHPNLVQFIGATSEGEIIILTELMPTSLRVELEREHLLHNQAISIGLDVARALNYLHLMQPDSFIHRNISSANVLLEPLLPNGHWKAKVSDYGAVNLQHLLHTSNPGNTIYSAPEANDSRQQSPKIDIFSFGVLLIEMLTSELSSFDEREELNTIRHQPLLNLIKRCLSYHKEDRPDASNIISELEN